MAKIITFFNHKGGVGKTTLAYNVAWGLSAAGKNVLMIDADAQCNLTEITVDTNCWDEGKDDFDFLLANNIYEYLLHYIQPVPNQEIPSIELYSKKENLKLLTGSIRFAELEETVSLSLAGIGALGHIPTSTYSALQSIGSDADFIIVDLSPALSATNQLLLMLSDYFIVPVNPSIFSRQAILNLNEIFRRWNKNLSGFEIFIRKTKPLPKMLGIVCQNYRPYSRKEEENTQSARRFGERMNDLNRCAIELATDLNGFGMAVTPAEFSNIFAGASPYRIANIPDYNQLSVVSESEKIPVNGLTNAILQRHSINTQTYREKVEDFKKECASIVDGLLKLE